MTMSKIRLPLTYLKPGDTCYTDEPSLVVTSLRSSVAVMMFNKRLHFTGICHVRPVNCASSETCTGHCDESFTRMDCATKQMLEVFEFVGIARDEIDVKVFSGASASAHPDIGIFLSGLHNDGLRTPDSYIGKDFMRKILFFTHTGEVFAKQIKEIDMA